MHNRECESEDAKDSSKELRGIALPASVENNGLLITPREQVDAIGIDGSGPTIRRTLTIAITRPIVR